MSCINIDLSCAAVVVTVPCCVPSRFDRRLCGMWGFGYLLAGVLMAGGRQCFDTAVCVFHWLGSDREQATGKSCRICELRSVKQKGGVGRGGGAHGVAVLVWW